MVVFLVGKDTLKISEAYINAFPAFSCPLFASKNPIVNCLIFSFLNSVEALFSVSCRYLG